MIRTVGELIEELTKFPSDREVKLSVNGNERDVGEIDGIDPGVVWISAG